MNSDTEIVNLALSHLGISKEIASLETEKSQEASAGRRFYETTRDQILRDFPWPFANVFAVLPLVEENPNDEWAFSYRYPSDCLLLRRIMSGIRNDNRQSRIPYKIGKDSEGKLIYTDMESAKIEYTSLITEVSRFPVDFGMALSFRLAAYMAPRLTGGDPFKMGERAFKLYIVELTRAQASAVNEQQDEEAPQSEFIRSRDGDSDNQSNRNNASTFIWP